MLSKIKSKIWAYYNFIMSLHKLRLNLNAIPDHKIMLNFSASLSLSNRE